MKDVYLRAAEAIAEGKYGCSCDAVYFVSHTGRADPYSLVRNYADLFAPGIYNTGFWLDRAVSQHKLKGSEMKDWRITALLFMHWIYQDELRGKR